MRAISLYKDNDNGEEHGNYCSGFRDCRVIR